jgi:hypothetical protein
MKVQHTRDFGALVVIEGETYDDASAHAQQAAGRAGPDLRPPVRRLRHHGRPGHHRPGDAGRRSGPGGPAGADRRRRADQRRGHGRQGGQARHPHHRLRAGHVSVVHRQDARRRGPLRRPDHRRGHRGQAGRRTDLRRRPAADRRRAAAGGAAHRTGRGPVLQCREDHRRGGRRGLAGGAAGLSRAVPRQEVRPDPVRRQYRHAPAGLGPDPRTGARPAPGLAAHRRRRPPRACCRPWPASSARWAPTSSRSTTTAWPWTCPPRARSSTSPSKPATPSTPRTSWTPCARRATRPAPMPVMRFRRPSWPSSATMPYLWASPSGAGSTTTMLPPFWSWAATAWARAGGGRHQHVGQHHRERLVADHVAGAPHRVAQAQRGHLADEAHLARLRQVAADVGRMSVLPLASRMRPRSRVASK